MPTARQADVKEKGIDFLVVQEGNVAIMTLPTPWYRPRKRTARLMVLAGSPLVYRRT